MIKAILFDFNGVIIDDEPIQFLAYQEVLRAENITLTESEYYECLGMNDKLFVQSTFKRAGKELTDEVLVRVVNAKSVAHGKMIEKELPLFPGVMTFIKASSREFSLALVSMARRVEIDYVLGRANLGRAFEVIVSAEDVETCKPDPACYVRGLRLLNELRRKNGSGDTSPRECLVIEDAPPGIESGRSAGMHTLGITNTVSAKELRESGADVVSASLADWTIGAVRHVFNSG